MFVSDRRWPWLASTRAVYIPAVVGVFFDEVTEDVDEVDVTRHGAGDDGELEPAVAAEQAERGVTLLVDGRS